MVSKTISGLPGRVLTRNVSIQSCVAACEELALGKNSGGAGACLAGKYSGDFIIT